MDPTQLAQLQHLQSMYGPGRGFQPQAFQVPQTQPLAPAGGGGGGAAPAAAPPGGGGGGGGSAGGGNWAQTLMPLMKGLMGRQPQPAAGAAPAAAQPAGVPSGIAQSIANPGAVNGVINSWPYAR